MNPAPDRQTARCLHSERGDCLKCRAFTRGLTAAVKARDTEWKPGILAALNRQSQAHTAR